MIITTKQIFFIFQLLKILICVNGSVDHSLNFQTREIEERGLRFGKEKNKYKKKSVVLIEYPRKGIWAVGFATKENEGEIANKVKKKLLNVFVPTTPNPTSGFLLMVPLEDIIYLDMSFEEASKFIVSAGTTNP